MREPFEINGSVELITAKQFEQEGDLPSHYSVLKGLANNALIPNDYINMLGPYLNQLTKIHFPRNYVTFLPPAGMTERNYLIGYKKAVCQRNPLMVNQCHF